MVSQDLGESVCASGVHQVSQELHILWSELFFILHVNVDEISLANLHNIFSSLKIFIANKRGYYKIKIAMFGRNLRIRIYVYFYLSCDGVKLGVVVGDDRKNSGEFVVNKVVVILAIVEGI